MMTILDAAQQKWPQPIPGLSLSKAMSWSEFVPMSSLAKER